MLKRGFMGGERAGRVGSRPGRLVRLTGLLAGLVVGWVNGTAALAGRLRSFGGDLQAEPTADARLDATIGLVAAAAALVLLTWLVASLAMALVSAALRAGPATSLVSDHGHLAERVTPRPIRRVAALLLGVGLVAAPFTSSAAAAGPPPGTESHNARCTTDRPAAPSPDRPAPSLDRPAASGDPPRTVRVHRSDTLWGIASRHLGPGADDGQVARAWPRWHRANRSVIGADPDHLMPGQLLRPPTSKEHQ